MHDTAYRIGGLAMQLYCDLENAAILEVGSQNVNGTLRDFALPTTRYTGLDIEAGEGVDLVMEPGKPFPVEDEAFDLVMATSVFEHDPAFWVTFVEMCRKAKPQGYIYVSAPSNGLFHQYPQDNWRFYPDCGLALVEWARSQGQEISLVETFVAERGAERVWNDFVGVFRKGPPGEGLPKRLISEEVPCTNVRTWRSGNIERRREATEDMEFIRQLEERANGLVDQAEAARRELLEVQNRVVSLESALAQRQEEITQVNAELAGQKEAYDTLQQALETEKMAIATQQNDHRRKIDSLNNLLAEREVQEKRSREEADWLQEVGTILLNGSGSRKSRLLGLLPASFLYKRQQKLLKRKGLFDGEAYLAAYPDVAKERMNPLRHYLKHGIKENRYVVHGSGPGEWANASANKRPPEQSINPYAEWVLRYDTISPSDIIAMREAIKGWSNKPLISVVVPVYNTPENLLRETIQSVLTQAYEHWELCIADDCSSELYIRRLLDEYAARDSRVKVVYRKTNGHISEASNSAISISTGDWIALLDHDDVLAPHALYCIADAINSNPDVKLLYSDEDKLNPDGRRDDPYFKCDWNLELFRSHNLITHLGVYHRPLIEEIGGFRSEFDGAQDYDLALRCVERLNPGQIYHVPRVLYHWRMIAGSTALSTEEKPYAMLAGERALNEHYKRLGIDATAELIGFGFKTVYRVGQPLVSIIIPTRNAKRLVEQCISSILSKSTYPNYEIVLVDNGSDEPEALAYFQKLAKDLRLTVVRDERPFNYSALNNNAIQHCNGDVIVLLNNDTEVISCDWLETLVGTAMQPDVGAVGAKLLYPDGRVQHAGVIIGMGGVAGHAHHSFGRNDPGFKGRLALANEYSAVTAACLAVKKEHFLAVDGLNETDLTVAFNDVDFCLKLKSKGLRNVYTPFAELYHHESATRGYEYESPEKTARFEKEKAYMIHTWKRIIAHDPNYSPNLTLDGADFGLASPPRLESVW